MFSVNLLVVYGNKLYEREVGKSCFFFYLSACRIYKTLSVLEVTAWGLVGILAMARNAFTKQDFAVFISHNNTNCR